MNTLSQPLAEILRPKTIDDVIGQDHLLGDDCPIRNAVMSNKLPSIILWGPPGVGKTSIAYAIANSVNYEFISLSAVLSGVKDIREAVDKANFSKDQNQKKTMLFIDEVHRFNKSQQDAFLPHVENGLFTFIGATTENPSFEVNSALLSRCQVYILNSLSNEALKTILNKALSIQENIKLDDSSTEFIIEYANGDGRRLLNLVEVIYFYSKDKPIEVDIDLIKKILSVCKKNKILIRKKSKIFFIKDRPGHDFRYALDCAKIKKQLKWKKTTSINEGLNQTVKWYYKNQQFFKMTSSKIFNKRLGLKL